MENRTTEQKIHTEQAHPKASSGNFRKGLIWVGIVSVLVIAGIVYLMVISSPETSETIKNASIILFIFSSLLGTIAVILLIVQLATLINLLRNEMKPILKSSQETVNNIKGTASFLGDKMVTPVIQTNAKIAGVSKIASILVPGLFNKNKRS